ncbi:MAG TPA: hypothetical protein VG411_01930 [Actinomycetota bacterium]|nr:hypothetical protein [Actinomycetota bacterium]
MIPAASAFRASSDQSIPDDAETPVVYNSDGYDTAGIAVVKQTSGDDLDIALGVDSEFQMCWLAPFPL